MDVFSRSFRFDFPEERRATEMDAVVYGQVGMKQPTHLRGGESEMNDVGRLLYLNVPSIASIYLNMKTWRHRVDKDMAKLSVMDTSCGME